MTSSVKVLIRVRLLDRGLARTASRLGTDEVPINVQREVADPVRRPTEFGARQTLRRWVVGWRATA